MNYAHWECNAFEMMLKNLQAIVHVDEVLSIAKAGSLYKVVVIDKRRSNF